MRSATAPGSARAGSWLRISSTVAASVHGPHAWIFSGPWYPSATYLQGVEIGGQEDSGPAEVAARAARRTATPAAVSSHGQVNEWAAVRPVRSTRAPGRELGEMGHQATPRTPAAAPLADRCRAASRLPSRSRVAGGSGQFGDLWHPAELRVRPGDSIDTAG